MLLTYGWVVIAICLFAIREKGWRPLLWLTVIGAAAYVLAAVEAGPGADHSWLAAHSPVIFALACAAAGLLFARDSLRSKLGLSFLLLACFATIVYSMGVNRIELGVSLVGTIAAYLIARELETDARWLVIGNVVLPLGFLFATVVSTSDRTAAALAAAALTAVAAVLAWEDEEERSHHLFVTAIASGVAIVLYLADFDTRCIAALALHAALFSMILRSTRARLLAPPIVIGLLIASGWTEYLLEERGLYSYTPFLTMESLCAFAVVLSWAIFALALKPTPEEKSPEHAQLSSLVSGLAIIAAFMWVRQELVNAWSPDAASFALIMYYALAGLALIFAGPLPSRRPVARRGTRARILCRLQGARGNIHDRCGWAAGGRAHPRRSIPRSRRVLVQSATGSAGRYRFNGHTSRRRRGGRRATLVRVREQIILRSIRAFHPFNPFVTCYDLPCAWRPLTGFILLRPSACATGR